MRFGFITLMTLMLTLVSCEEDPPFVLTEDRGCVNFADTRGFAEINGKNLWLELGEIIPITNDDLDIFVIRIAANQPDCSLYERFEITIELEADSIVNGTYELLSESSQEIPFAAATYFTRAEGEFITTNVPIIEGTVSIVEISPFKYEVILEAITNTNTPITVRYIN